MRHQDATTWILCAQKVRGNSSHELYRALRRAGINCYRVTAGTRPRYSPKRVRTIINWGVSRMPIWIDDVPEGVQWINHPDTIKMSSNKWDMQVRLGWMGLDSTPYKSTAARWIDQGHTVVTRTVLNGCQGKGIVLSPQDPLPDADLYTQLYTGHRVREYRVYISNGKAVDIVEKRRMRRSRLEELGIDGRDPYTRLIRAHKNGWVFAHNNLQASDNSLRELKRFGELAAARFDLGIGGIDIIASFNESDASDVVDMRVIETNTQIGINGCPSTADRLVEGLKEEVLMEEYGP